MVQEIKNCICVLKKEVYDKYDINIDINYDLRNLDERAVSFDINLDYKYKMFKTVILNYCLDRINDGTLLMGKGKYFCKVELTSELHV